MPWPNVVVHDRGVEISNEAGKLLVDGSAHQLLVDAPASGVWELGASRAGVGQVLALARDELGLGHLGSDDARALYDAVVACLRRAAQEAGARSAALERQIDQVRRTPLVYAQGFLRTRFLRDDAARFRACRVAIAQIEPDDDDDGTPEHTDAIVERLARWRDLFAHDNRARRAHNVTLATYGEEASAHALWGLRHVPLSGPTRSLYHLEVLGALGAHPRARQLRGHMALVAEASAESMAKALLLIGEQRLALATPGVTSAHALAEALASVPSARGVNSFDRLVELTDYWWSFQHPDSTPVALPPIPLPHLPGVTLLRTFGEILDEGRRMRHCVATRRLDALAGRAFLFHVDSSIGDEEATVQVDDNGDVVEARGPGNEENMTVRWAQSVLRDWGRGFWASRVGLSEGVWRLRVPVQHGTPLKTVSECLAEYQRACSVTPDDSGGLARWWMEHVESARRGDVMLVARPADEVALTPTGGTLPLVVAVDGAGRAVGSTYDLLEFRRTVVATPELARLLAG